MEELNKIATGISLLADSAVKVLDDKLRDCYHQGKSRAGSTPYASKRKKKRKKRN